MRSALPRVAPAATLALLGALAALPAPALARTTCQPTPQGPLCVSEVDFAGFSQQAFQSQYQSQWCWAASVAMVFAYQGHPVEQARIVAEVYGTAVNLPAQAGLVIARQLDRDWIDDLGQPFSSRLTAAFDADAGYFGLDNARLVAELDRGNPLVIGARAHAMVLTAVQYYPTPQGPYIVAGGVFDPWPGAGARGLAPDELTPVQAGGSLRFLAAVEVTTGAGEPGPWTPAPPPGPSGDLGGSSSGCAATATGSPPAPWPALLLLAAWLRRRRPPAA